MTTHSQPLIQKAQILGDTVYSPMAFAKILGFRNTNSWRKRRKDLFPLPKGIHIGNVIISQRKSEVPELLGTSFAPQIHPKQLFLNFKGGTGKSTISASYGFRLAQMGVQTLLIDLDPQGHLTQCLGLASQQFTKTLFNALIEKEEIEKVIVKTDLPTLDVIPSNLNLSPVELSLFSMNSREFD